MGVKAAFTSVYHTQSNGAVGKLNALIFTAIKKILENQSECIDIYSHKEDIRESTERQMGGRIAKSSMESQHPHLQCDKIHPFQIAIQRRASNL
jgi:hypothetical protein